MAFIFDETSEERWMGCNSYCYPSVRERLKRFPMFIFGNLQCQLIRIKCIRCLSPSPSEIIIIGLRLIIIIGLLVKKKNGSLLLLAAEILCMNPYVIGHEIGNPQTVSPLMENIPTTQVVRIQIYRAA